MAGTMFEQLVIFFMELYIFTPDYFLANRVQIYTTKEMNYTRPNEHRDSKLRNV